MIDLIVDQSPEGLEVLRGASTYTYDGNWKVQAENGADGTTSTAAHWNYAATTARRTSGESTTESRPWTQASGTSSAAATGLGAGHSCSGRPGQP